MKGQMILASRFRRLRRASGLVARTMLTALTVISLLCLSGSPPARADGLTVEVSSGTYDEGDYVGITIVTVPAAGPTATYDVAGALPAGVTWAPGSDFIGGTLANGSHGDYPLTITVTSAPNSGTASITLTVVECRPEIGSIGNQLSPTGSAVTPVVFTVSDLDGDLPLAIGITGLPSGLGYVPATGSSTQISTPVTISGTITAPVGNYPVIVTVTDKVGLSASRPFNWQVFDPVPVLSPIGDQSSAEGQTKYVDISATDNGAALTFSLVGNPPWITITGTGAKIARITAVTPTPGAGTYTFTVFVKDSLDQPASEEIDWVVNNQPPVITPITNRSSAEGAPVSLQVQADDPELDPKTYGATPGCLPGGLSISTTSGLISGTVGPQAAQNFYGGSSTLGTYVVTVSATDGHSAPTTSTFTWTITDPTTPTLSTSNISDRTTAQGAGITPFTISGTDTDSPTPDSLTYSAGSPSPSTLPSGITLNETTGQISGTPDVHSQGRYTVRLTCSDGRNTSAARTFTWTVTDTILPNVTSAPGNQSTPEGSSVNLQVTATEPEGDTLRYSATGLPPGISIHADDGHITGTVANNAAQTSSGTFYVTITVTDGYNNVNRSFTWTVTDTTTPTFTTNAVNTNQEVNEGATPSPLIAVDTDSDRLTYSKASGTFPEGLSLNSDGTWSGTASMKSAGTYSLTITVSDGVRSSSTTLSLKIKDTSAPVFTNGSSNRMQTVQTGQGLVPVRATDSDNDKLTYSSTGTLPPGIIFVEDGSFLGVVSTTASGQYRLTITVSDGTLTATTTLSIFVEQTVQPMTIILKLGSSQPTVNGVTKTLDAPAFVTSNGRTMVPVRFITEVMGAQVDYDNTTRRVTVKLAPNTVVLTIGSTTAVVNGQNRTLDAPAQISQNRTFVPIRFISEAFGLIVDYNSTTRTVTISRK